MQREKVFGGRHVPLDRNAKARIKVFAHALKQPSREEFKTMLAFNMMVHLRCAQT
jgi:hypothetical protein